eukprot:4452744-Alexandrium_andersonii.AAC.1
MLRKTPMLPVIPNSIGLLTNTTRASRTRTWRRLTPGWPPSALQPRNGSPQSTAGVLLATKSSTWAS